MLAPSDRAVRESWSRMARGASPAKTVTVLASGENPRSTCSGSQPLTSSCSPMQQVNLPGCPRVDMSTSPGRPPPTLRTSNCSARPMVALARNPCPKALPPQFRPMRRRIGPLTTMTGVAK